MYVTVYMVHRSRQTLYAPESLSGTRMKREGVHTPHLLSRKKLPAEDTWSKLRRGSACHQGARQCHNREGYPGAPPPLLSIWTRPIAGSTDGQGTLSWLD